jgi:hypothetical protein
MENAYLDLLRQHGDWSCDCQCSGERQFFQHGVGPFPEIQNNGKFPFPLTLKQGKRETCAYLTLQALPKKSDRSVAVCCFFLVQVVQNLHHLYICHATINKKPRPFMGT